MKKNRRYLLTGAIVLLAIIAVLFKYLDYVKNPWTRNGQVCAEVIQVTPRVSGPIVKLPIKDNQLVKAGDLLFQIDPRTFEASLAQARAAVLQAETMVKEVDSEIEKNKAEFERQQELLPKRATSQRSVERAKANHEVSAEKRNGALASLGQAQAARRQAELNLEFTQVKAPVDSYVTNLNLRLGSQSVANQPALALVDINSFWIYGFFKETLIGKIRKGDKAIVTLMTYPNTPIDGYVDSLGWGIAQQDGSTGFELLPNVSPTFEWIRLAQRVPVRIHLNNVPKGIELRIGTTASVLVMTGSTDSGTQE
ncbi:MAG: HlyD family secretion protein [Planctomycetota bacterium]|jgi:RND family efflux transporter MFP subunit